MSVYAIDEKKLTLSSHHFDKMSAEEIRALICQTEILHDLPRQTCDALLASGRIVQAPAGAHLFDQGESAERCYVLLSGEIKLLLLTPEGKRVIIDIIGPGMHLGFFVALTENVYPISAEPVEASYLYSWDAMILRGIILDTPRLILNALSALTKRVMCLQNKVQHLATERVEQRIAHSLLTLAHHVGKELDEGVLINMPLTHRDLAEMSGTNIYSVSRILHKWETHAIIETGRKRVVLRSPERLPCHAAKE